jgi:hypothetical protein
MLIILADWLRYLLVAGTDGTMNAIIRNFKGKSNKKTFE